MASQNRASCAVAFHTLVAILLFLVGGVVLGYGLYLHFQKNYQLAYDILTTSVANNQNLNNNNVANVHIQLPRANIVLIIIGSVLLLGSILALLSLLRKCAGAFFRILYGLTGFVMLAGLGVVAGVLFYLVARESSASFQSDAQAAWEGAVQASPTDICTIESHFKCRGFNDNDCGSTCVLGTESTCTPTQKLLCAPCGGSSSNNTGCFNDIKGLSRTEFIVIGSVAAALSAFVLVDLFVLCCL